MDIIVRNYNDNDVEAIQNMNNLLSLQIQWHGDYDKTNAFVAQENGKVVGVGALCYESSWGYHELPIEHDIRIEIAVDSLSNNQDEIIEELLKVLKTRTHDYKQHFNNNQIVIRNWFEGSNLHMMQLYLQQGFFMKRVCPVLAFKVEKEIKHYQIPTNIKIEQLTLDEESMDAYIKATGVANDGICDSMALLQFRRYAENFRIFVAKDKDTIVSGVTVWDEPDGESVTEDIFTIPEYRRKNIARETIATALEDIKQRNRAMATLSLRGENEKAMRLYQSTGYELLFLLIELNYRV